MVLQQVRCAGLQDPVHLGRKSTMPCVLLTCALASSVRLMDGSADDFDSILRRAVVKDREGAAVESATRHRRSAFEIIVDRGFVVEV